jgi:hypothetical protein
MEKRMRYAALIVSLLACSPAFASGGLSCDAEDEAVKISIGGGVTRGMGGSLFSFEGFVELRSAAVPEDRRHAPFQREHVAQYWLDERSLNLRLYRERGADMPHGYVELALMTQAGVDDEGTYGGRYELTIYDVDRNEGELRLEGPVSCMVE